MHGSLDPEEHVWQQTKPTDLWDDMARLNALYEELMWDSLDVLEFVADYDNDRIIITNKTHKPTHLRISS